MHAGQLAMSDLDEGKLLDAGAAAGVQVLSVSVHTSMAPLEAVWRALEALNSNSLHQSFEACSAWVRAFGRPLAIVEGQINGDVAFILPLEIVRGRLFTTAQFIGAMHSNINTGLMSEAFLKQATPEIVAAFAQKIRAAVKGADCILLTNIPETWRGVPMPFAMLPSVENQNHAFALQIKSSFAETLSQLNAKRRRKKYSVSHRRLEALGGYEHIVGETPEDRRKLLDLFFTQKSARLAEFGLPNAFACTQTRKYLHQIAQMAGDECNLPLRLHALRMTGGEHRSEIPAIAGISRKGDHIIVQFCSIGAGPTLEASPGELLFHLMIERYNSENIALFDFGIGDMAFKRSWCTNETVQVNVTLPLTSLGRLAALKEEAATRLKATIKQNPALYSFLQRMRAKNGNAPVDIENSAED